MNLNVESGLWSTDVEVDGPPLEAVLEVAGAVLSWTVDAAADSAPRITFTDARRADWLWRVVGESGHIAVLSALDERAVGGVQLADVDLGGEALLALRRLAIGHWLRRWWPASVRDGIPALDPLLLEAELAVLTVAAEYAFSDDTLDSDVTALLAPHAADLPGYAAGGDPRVAVLIDKAIELAEDLGCLAAGPSVATLGARADYALAAGPAQRQPDSAIASGVGSLSWAGVAPGAFDAAEDTVEWSISVADSQPVAMVRVARTGPGSPAGVPVRLQAPGVIGAGSLDSAGNVVLALIGDDQRPIAESVAWNQNWVQAVVTVGVPSSETPQARDRVRRFARARMSSPTPDSYVAEQIAADSQY